MFDEVKRFMGAKRPLHAAGASCFVGTLHLLRAAKHQHNLLRSAKHRGANVKKNLILCLAIALLLALLLGCQTETDGNNISFSENNSSEIENGDSAESGEVSVEQTVTYEQISQEEAKRLMDSEASFVILDVRSYEEYIEGHILYAVLIPDDEITERAESVLTDKSELILVYCRSGRRSKNAAEQLARLGYTNVKEFGGIIDWKYDTVTGE